jgi:hypothetical protein
VSAAEDPLARLTQQVEFREGTDLGTLSPAELQTWRAEGERLREEILKARREINAELWNVAKQADLTRLLRRIGRSGPQPANLDLTA